MIRPDSNDASLRSRLPQTAFAFGGYNVTNMGRTPELLAHPAYGPIVAGYLREASRIYAEVLKQPVDLVARMREGRESRGVRGKSSANAGDFRCHSHFVRLPSTFMGNCFEFDRDSRCEGG